MGNFCRSYKKHAADTAHDHKRLNYEPVGKNANVGRANQNEGSYQEREKAGYGYVTYLFIVFELRITVSDKN